MKHSLQQIKLKKPKSTPIMDSLHFLLLILAIITAINLTESSPSPTQPPLQPLDRITDALIGAEDFAGWANILSSAADPSTLPMTATFFIPSNDAISHLHSDNSSVDSFLIPYHIVPQRLTFDELQNFSIRTRLPTLLPGKFIVVTNNSVGNFAVDGSRVTHPDLFVTGSFSVHGVMDVLDYSVSWGEEVCVPQGVNDSKRKKKKKKKKHADFAPSPRSNASSILQCEFSRFVSSAVCSFIAFKILQFGI